LNTAQSVRDYDDDDGGGDGDDDNDDNDEVTAYSRKSEITAMPGGEGGGIDARMFTWCGSSRSCSAS